MFLSIDTIRRKLRIFLFLKPVSLSIELLRIWFIYSIEINVINIIYWFVAIKDLSLSSIINVSVLFWSEFINHAKSCITARK